MKSIVLGTSNAGKVKEIRSLLEETGFKIIELIDFEFIDEPEESGKTFADNAVIKAKYYAEVLGRNVLADDSGLSVRALGGGPGVFSARFAGKNADDAQNNEKLLKELEAADSTDRSAKFVCEMALADSKGNILFRASGFCKGTIACKPIGLNGFGYDPLFIPDGYDKSFGELPVTIKKLLSHRAAATSKIADFLNANSGVLT